MDDPEPICLRPPPMSQQVFTDTEHCDSYDDNLWDHSFVPHFCLLGSCAISIWVNVIFFMAYVKFSPICMKTWTGFSEEAYHEVLSFLKLAIPSAIMIWYV